MYNETTVDGLTILSAQKSVDCEKLLGEWVDESNYDRVITDDTDLYAPTGFGEQNSEKNIIFKFRKNVFSREEQQGAFEGLAPAAIESQNRGLASGPRRGQNGKRDWVSVLQEDIIDAILTAADSSLDDDFDAIEHAIANHKPSDAGRGRVWLRDRIKKTGVAYTEFFDHWLDTVRPLSAKERKVEATKLCKEFISDTTYANTVFSGIAGWFDRYPRIPYGRATAYTERNEEVFAKSYPYLQTLARKFEELLPERYAAQKAFTDKIDPRFVVPKTPYTTITVNKTFRTAAHRDAGDFSDGFSNISCISESGKKEWGGCLFVLPEYRIAVDLHPGDLLLVNNHEGIHGNTEITGDDPMRISLVCYAREKMAELGSYEYETLRRNFVDTRRKDESHELHRPLWNGVSEGMWSSEEWYDFVRANGDESMLSTYHPEALVEQSTLEEFF